MLYNRTAFLFLKKIFPCALLPNTRVVINLVELNKNTQACSCFRINEAVTFEGTSWDRRSLLATALRLSGQQKKSVFAALFRLFSFSVQ